MGIGGFLSKAADAARAAASKAASAAKAVAEKRAKAKAQKQEEEQNSGFRNLMDDQEAREIASTIPDKNRPGQPTPSKEELAEATADELGHRILGEKKDAKPKASIAAVADAALPAVLAGGIPSAGSIFGAWSGIFDTQTTIMLIASAIALALGLFVKRKLGAFGSMFMFLGVAGLILTPILFTDLGAVARAAGVDTGSIPGFEGAEGAKNIWEVWTCLITNPGGCATSLENETETQANQISEDGLTIINFMSNPQLGIRPGNNFRMELTVENKGKVDSYGIAILNISHEWTSSVNSGNLTMEENACNGAKDNLSTFLKCDYAFRPLAQKLFYWEWGSKDNISELQLRATALLDYNYTVESLLKVEAYPTLQRPQPVGSTATEGSAKLSLYLGNQPMERGESRILSMVVSNNKNGIIFSNPASGDDFREPIKIVTAIPTTVFDLTDYSQDTIKEKCFVSEKTAVRSYGECEPADSSKKCVTIELPNYKLEQNDQFSVACKLKVRDDIASRITSEVRSHIEYWYRQPAEERTVTIKP
jgi:hypothetical protein